MGSAIWSIVREAASRGPSALADILVFNNDRPLNYHFTSEGLLTEVSCCGFVDEKTRKLKLSERWKTTDINDNTSELSIGIGTGVQVFNVAINTDDQRQTGYLYRPSLRWDIYWRMLFASFISWSWMSGCASRGNFEIGETSSNRLVQTI